ncbi:MAG: tRNA (adenosine(37)-N6)-dimethylallyltransferase MiaA [Phascolarctobacterium sp.]|nr:tRNA (adenosine(37)-N6)-dimethylallyltransferase MiaA [Phascolarctobacterium sp.]
MKERVVVILGPTATGKSNCAIEVARRLNGEIISGDSSLVYQKMNIGTAKPSKEELALVPHHLVDILPPEASFNVVDFVTQAKKLITEINARGHLPIIAGGTGLYIKALLEGYEFSSVDEDTELRKRLEDEARQSGPVALYEKLQQIDSDAAKIIHPNNVRRVIRALEIAMSGSHVSQAGTRDASIYDATVFGLRMDRDFLYARINKRVDMMLDAGLEDEVRSLLDAGLSEDAQSMQAIGYRQMVWYLRHGMDRELAIEKIKQATRNFAKRQLTWYKKMPYVHWFDVDETLNYSAIVQNMVEILEEKRQML